MAAVFSGCFVVLSPLLLRLSFTTANPSTVVVDDATKLGALCVSEMRKVWERPINSKGHLSCFGSFASVAFCSLGDGSVDMVLFL